jgi:hypothetical protein
MTQQITYKNADTCSEAGSCNEDSATSRQSSACLPVQVGLSYFSHLNITFDKSRLNILVHVLTPLKIFCIYANRYFQKVTNEFNSTVRHPQYCKVFQQRSAPQGPSRPNPSNSSVARHCPRPTHKLMLCWSAQTAKQAWDNVCLSGCSMISTSNIRNGPSSA